MKKTLLIGAVLSLMAGQMIAGEPVILPEFYTITMSPNGKFVAGEIENATIYDVEKGDFVDYLNSQLGNGNCMALNGLVVGSAMEAAVIMKDGEEILPTSFEKYPLSYLQGITPDATRVCGVMSNLDNQIGNEGMMYVPFYADFNADGTLGEPHVLPNPDKDYTGRIPQYSSAVWISNDGKTILGQVTDYAGFLQYPIVYKQDDKGDWTYSLPSEKLINPNHLTIPEDPGEFLLTPPEPLDYMSPENKAKYEEAFNAWVASGYQQDLYPEYGDYMTPEQIEAYNAASDEYNTAAQAYNDKLNAYNDALFAILDESVNFEQNSMAISPDGKKFVMAAKSEEPGDFMPVEITVNYIFDLTDNTYSPINSVYKEVAANFFLSDGTLVGSTPMPGPWSASPLPPESYIKIAGASDFEPIEKYLAATNPEAAEWMDKNLKHEMEVGYDENNDWAPIYEEVMFSGHLGVSDDMTVISGGVLAYNFSDEYTYMSYLMTGLQSGVDEIVAEKVSNISIKSAKGGVLVINGGAADVTVYDLAGRAVYSASGVSGLVNTGLGSGIYVVSAKGQGNEAVSAKVAF